MSAQIGQTSLETASHGTHPEVVFPAWERLEEGVEVVGDVVIEEDLEFNVLCP